MTNRDPRREAEIVDSWRLNAAPWTAAVRDRRIESRALVTDRAIVETVLGRAPRSVLDIGCGEGWLARVLAAHGVRVVGIDVVPELVEQARRAGGGDFRVQSYEELASGPLEPRVDVAVANFSLLGDGSVAAVLSSAAALLAPEGALVVQTLHPLVACGEHRYEDGWRTGSWAGFSGAFSQPAPWYFRTMESWLRLLASSGWRLVELREPLHPATGKPASVVFVAEPARHPRAPDGPPPVGG